MDIKKAKLPPIYNKNGRECYLDPIRKRLIYITPEETVRQRVASSLIDELNVPDNMIRVEEHLSHYGIKSNERADIVILEADKEYTLFPIAVIECKADAVPIDENAIMQAFDYSNSLGSVYTLITNGKESICYKYIEERNEYIAIENLPNYTEMLDRECKEIPKPEPFERVSFELIEKAFLESSDENSDNYCPEISKYTPQNIALPVFNLWQGFLDEKVKMPTRNYGLFDLLEDYGIRFLSYGNSAGGQFYGLYRSFLVNVNGSAEFFSIGFSTYIKASWNEKKDKEIHPLTCISVAHDDEKSSHHALQLIVDEDAVAEKNTVKFYHNGRISIGNIGSGKKAELRELIKERYPKILFNDKYYLGSITSDHLLRLDEPDVIDLVVNLISYSIVRDEFREIVKAKKNKK